LDLAVIDKVVEHYPINMAFILCSSTCLVCFKTNKMYK